jgi:hypothetical protein
LRLRGKQGDQIERIFANWAIVYFGQCFENYQRSTNSWATFSTVPTKYVLFLQITGWATFWATFSESHLVTLTANQCAGFVGW